MSYLEQIFVLLEKAKALTENFQVEQWRVKVPENEWIAFKKEIDELPSDFETPTSKNHFITRIHIYKDSLVNELCICRHIDNHGQMFISGKIPEPIIIYPPMLDLFPEFKI